MNQIFLRFIKSFIPALGGQFVAQAVVIKQLGISNHWVRLGVEFVGALGAVLMDRWAMNRLMD